MKQRADRLLVDLGLAKSRTHAKDLISEGLVFVSDKPVVKASQEIDSSTPISEFQIQSGNANRFVSRGGLKLEGALRRSGLSPAGLICLDLGISTGGFTDCLLRAGAAKVVGVDVGHNQLDPRLAKDDRVVLFEGVNARELSPERLGRDFPASGFDLIVMDLSFISLKLIWPQLGALVSDQGQVLALAKPQFEVGAEHLNRRGILDSEESLANLQKELTNLVNCDGWTLRDYFESPIEGRDGNREFFLWAQRHP